MLWLLSIIGPIISGIILLTKAGTARRKAQVDYLGWLTHTELAIKAGIGKIALPADLPALLTEQGLQPLTFTDSHAVTLAEFPQLARHDPFDRMLLAQATADKLTFATADARLLSLSLSGVIDARV